MPEYIEREALLSELAKGTIISDDLYGMGIMSGVDFAKKKIVEQPAADVAHVVHGRWVGLEYDGYADGFPVYDLWECSECGEEVRGKDVPDTHPYCNGCGAKMDATDINVGDKEETK